MSDNGASWNADDDAKFALVKPERVPPLAQSYHNTDPLEWNEVMVNNLLVDPELAHAILGRLSPDEILSVGFVLGHREGWLDRRELLTKRKIGPRPRR